MEHLSFKGMRQNPTLNLEPILQVKNGPGFVCDEEIKFIRKGRVGDWKNHMSDEMSEKFDKWTEENLKDTGLIFETS